MALFVFFVAAYTLVPGALTQPQFIDEQFYTWAGGFFWSRLIHLNFDPSPGPDPLRDPGWQPGNWWFISSPQGFRLAYGAVMKVAQVQPPARALEWGRRYEPQPEADVPRDTLLVVRLFSVFCASLGYAALPLRFGWIGFLFALLSFPAFPQQQFALSHAMAEGPLILALGLCVMAYGSAWFGSACALAASCKLTALGAWPLLMVPGANGAGRPARWIGPAVAVALWTALNPGAWLAGGPLYLISEAAFRLQEQADLSAVQPNQLGFYLPPWYTTALEFGITVAFAAVVSTLLNRSQLPRRLRANLRSRFPSGGPWPRVPL